MKAFVVTVPAGDVDVASDRLWTLGVRAVEERAGGAAADGTDTIELWTMVGDEPPALDAAAAAMDPGWAWRVADVDPTPADTWRRFARPVAVRERVVLAPSWAGEEAEREQPGAVVVRIEPGAAFGLGDHPTTQLSLALMIDELDRLAAHTPGARSVLDVGCGTGVLAIAAARLGAVPIRAIDTSAAAVESTDDNARRNGVAGLIADTTALEHLDGRYDIVVANILAPTLCMLADDLRRVTAAGGALIISGVLADRHAHVLAALAPFGVEATETLDGWAAIRLRAP